MGVLRVSCRPGGAGFVVGLELEGAGPRRSAVAEVGFGLSAQDREDVRWYLEDYLQYPVAPAPQVAGRVQARLAELGADLFRQVFEANRDTIAVVGRGGGVAACHPGGGGCGDRGRVGGAVGAAAGPGHGRGAGAAGGRVRADPPRDRCPGAGAGSAGRVAGFAGDLPAGGREDVPFRSVASHLVRLSRGAREAFRLDVLRPPAFAELARVLEAAKAAGEPYQVVHFDGHGTWLDEETAAAAGGGAGRGVQPGGVLAGVAAAAGLARVPGLRGPGYRREAAAGGRPGAGRGCWPGPGCRCWC